MAQLIELFAPHLRDHTTLDELREMIRDHKTWPRAHALFRRILDKTLAAEKRGNKLQYSFEEICAKSLYNLSYEPAPFDSDSPYWIIPNAIALARCLNINEGEVMKIIAS